MIHKILLFSTLCLLSVPAFATEADFQKRMARGVAALEAGETAAALEEFRAAVKEHPEDTEAALYLAIALNRANEPDAESALKGALRQEPDNLRINLELGILYYNKKMFDEAGDYFENLLTLKPEPDIRSAAEGYLANIRKQGAARKWEAFVTGGMQYDSNVPLANSDVQLPVGIERRGDMRGILSLALKGTALQDSSQELTGRYSLYQSLHMRLTDFNLTQNRLDLTYKRKFSPVLTAGISGDFESILLGGEQFVNDFSFSPGLYATFQEGMASSIEYRLQSSYFKNSEIFTTNTERDGMTHALILSHRQPLSETVNIRVGYTFERDLTDVKAWSAVSHRGLFGASASLPYATLLDISLEAGSRKYDEIQAGTSEIRSDTPVTGAASLTWQAFERFAISAGYHYTKNSSNITGYDYTRGITSIMFQGRY